MKNWMFGQATGVAVRLGGFLLLVAMIFLVAYAAGRHVGPVTPVHGNGHDGGGGMRMSAVFAHSDSEAGAETGAAR